MVRTKRSANLSSRTARLKLAPSVRHQEHLHPGQYLAYRRPIGGNPGSWFARWYDAETKKEGQHRIGTADDSEDVSKNTEVSDLLTYEEAKEKTKTYIKGKRPRPLFQSQQIEDKRENIIYTVKECIDDYFKQCEIEGTNKNSQAKIASIAHIIPTLGDYSIHELTKGRLIEWLKKLAESPKRKRRKIGSTEIQYGKAPKTEDDLRARAVSANRIASILKAALSLAQESDKIDNNKAWFKLNHKKGIDTNRERHLTTVEQKELVKVCPIDLGNLVSGALYTGTRFGELSQLMIDDFDSNNGQITISPLIDKNKKGRRIGLTVEGWKYFKKICNDRDGTEYIFLRDNVKRRIHLDAENRWIKGDYTKLLKQACKDAKIKYCTFHELRHTAVSIWLNAGISLDDVAEQIGDSVATTKKFYAHLCPDDRTARIRNQAPELGINQTEEESTMGSADDLKK